MRLNRLQIVLLLVGTVCATSNPGDHHEQRKSARPSNNSPPTLNSLTSSQDAPTKPQLNAPQSPPYVRQPQTSTPQYSSAAAQPQSSIFTHIASNSQPSSGAPQQGGYILSVNAQGPSPQTGLSSG